LLGYILLVLGMQLSASVAGICSRAEGWVVSFEWKPQGVTAGKACLLGTFCFACDCACELPACLCFAATY
jgi:hypothetical protein